MSTVAEPITADELLKIPRGKVRHELIRGRLFTMSPAGSEHGVVISRLSSLLQQYVSSWNLGLVFGAETGFILERNPDTVRAPDIAFVRLDKVPESGIPEGYWPGPPDLAIEVISPSDTVRGVAEKAADWVESGARGVWVVDPRLKSITVYTAAGADRIFATGDTLDGGEVLPGFHCLVADIFRVPGQIER
jgi:Uma2 family endonuclease